MTARPAVRSAPAPAAPPPPSPPPHGGRRPLGGAVLPWVHLSPALAAVVLWVYLPLAATFVLSVMRWNLTGRERPFVGVDNYVNLVQDPAFARACWNTLLYALGVLPFSLVLPLAVAIGVWKRAGRARGLYRALLFAPVVLPPVVGAVMWQWLLNPLLGVVNVALGQVGLGPYAFLSSSRLALWSVVVVTGWKVFGLGFIIFSAALAGLERNPLEAARLDGATEWELTRFLVLPLLAPTILLMAFLTVTLGAQWAFSAVHTLTQGGPAGATDNVYYLLYRYGFGYFDTGTASALGVLVFVGFGLLAVVQLRLGEGLARAR